MSEERVEWEVQFKQPSDSVWRRNRVYQNKEDREDFAAGMREIGCEVRIVKRTIKEEYLQNENHA